MTPPLLRTLLRTSVSIETLARCLLRTLLRSTSFKEPSKIRTLLRAACGCIAQKWCAPYYGCYCSHGRACRVSVLLLRGWLLREAVRFGAQIASHKLCLATTTRIHSVLCLNFGQNPLKSCEQRHFESNKAKAFRRHFCLKVLALVCWKGKENHQRNRDVLIRVEPLKSLEKKGTMLEKRRNSSQGIFLTRNSKEQGKEGQGNDNLWKHMSDGMFNRTRQKHSGAAATFV